MSKLKDYALRINELAKQLGTSPKNEKIKADLESYNNMIVYSLETKKLPELELNSAEIPRTVSLNETKAGNIKKEILSKELRKRYLSEIHLEKEFLQGFIKPEKIIKPTKEVEYTIYQTSNYGMIANKSFEKFGVYLSKKYPGLFELLYRNLRASNIKILSKTYASILLFSGFLAGLLVLLFSLIISILLGVNPISAVVRAFAFALIASAATGIAVYLYPSTVVSSKRRAIKNDLPFVILHMSAVAGSGAQPISIFSLVLSSGEYKGLEPEIKKIVNYVNLFGYDLSTALRAVAETTPSPEFKELLTGITTTIETGGDLKSYLTGKSEDTLSTYKLERERYAQSLETYSDVYTGILIAAPLLFSVTLAIINMMGGKIGSLDVKTIALVGVYGIIPLLNLGFLLFLNTIQPKT